MHEVVSALDVGNAVDRALREAGGGRVAAVSTTWEYGRYAFLVQFVRGDWLCVATVDAATGEVTSVLDEGPRVPGDGFEAAAEPLDEVRLERRTVWDLAADGDLAWVATDRGVARLRWDGLELWVDAQLTTGYGATRHVAPVPGGVVGGTADGRVFRLAGDGTLGWERRLPAAPYTLAADPAGERLIVATAVGAVELDAADGRTLDVIGGPVRAAAYLAGGNRVLAGHRGGLRVLTPGGALLWCWDQGEYPERMWVQDDRVYLAGEGGLKEIVVGEGVVARWSSPGTESVDSAVVAAGRVFTCSGGSHVDCHGYATAALRHRVPGRPEALAVIGGTTLLVADRDGLISARPIQAG
ncbi:hypothetical protein [Actinoplanes sp. HUAS TT8]|uniref:hypothetical protein n=1 Tax=Actinoplanes sp. HUAS TT8 TaxID=3447453 RepID=UPI003F51C44D